MGPCRKTEAQGGPCTQWGCRGSGDSPTPPLPVGTLRHSEGTLQHLYCLPLALGRGSLVVAEGWGGHSSPQGHPGEVLGVEAVALLGVPLRAAALGVTPSVPWGGTEGGDALGQLWTHCGGGVRVAVGVPQSPRTPLPSPRPLTCSSAQALCSSGGSRQHPDVTARSSSGTGRLQDMDIGVISWVGGGSGWGPIYLGPL